MKILKVCTHVIILFLFYYTGVFIQTTFQLYVPGSIIGMVLLFIALSTKIVKVDWIEEGAGMLVKHLPLLFIPVTVGIIQYLDVFAGKGMFLIVMALLSTFMVMIGAGMTSQWLMRKREHEYE
ncbi:CidA/LrgA family protein [Pontibacillus litoralis]|uniref:Murein hydrolase transporter LrgA n=1 Tax=Pontibacillus litoralis JSM 072002 TaxID=1385512 RepID=A0A0A5GAB6_9BACI|nr:CidA/LrgA family protein [Pontibacillus litoralis]KGX88138.1 murein hydrolase transporter LrgA [Pontibacillus litoralis JSM 072002]